ncbi:MAG: glycosyltransferase family 2 protein [Patescibacteria group bacterium]
MSNSKIAINIVVLNGEKYIQSCLDSVLVQSCTHNEIEINILDNGSLDKTIPIIEELLPKLSNFSRVSFIKSEKNHGMWGGQEELLKNTHTPYVVFLSVDVVLDKDFIKEALLAMDENPKLGGLQAKVFQRHSNEIIDTCGFKVFRSRKVVNIGHGEKDNGQFDIHKAIFGVEGAVPVFRTEALESIRVLGEIADHDLFWYAEDLDVAWRLNLAGWEQHYVPSVIAWHDRQTTKRTSSSFTDFVKLRRTIPLRKRRLEWRNIRCTIIKNDYIINILKDLPQILVREVAMTAYLLIFETAVLTQIFSLAKLLPKMLRKRRVILSRAKTNSSQIYSYFN